MPAAKKPVKKLDFLGKKKPSALDTAISKGKSLPSKNKKPGRFLDK